MASDPISGSGVFDSDAVIALTDAYQHACAALGLVGRSGERAKSGELDPVRLCEAALEELRSHT
jgi:hypothetical protein